MQERYLGKAGPRCPGESACTIFQTAADIDDVDAAGRRLGKQHVCRGCELLPTKPATRHASADAEEIAEVVQEIEYLADTQAAGFRLKAKDLEPLIYELLILWARYRELAQQQNEQSLLMMALAPRM